MMGLIGLRVAEHLGYSALAVAIAALIAVPIGLYVGHTRRGSWIVAGANALRALPSLGVMTLLVLLIGLGLVPPMVALVILAIPPLIAGVSSGIQSVGDAAVDAARGMGMTEQQILWRVEVPNSWPLIISGFRGAALQVIATATIAAYVNLGGLGRFVFDGLSVYDYSEVLLGAVLVAALAVAVDRVLALLARLSAPGALRLRRARRQPVPARA